jgi:hypothetical protein
MGVDAKDNREHLHLKEKSKMIKYYLFISILLTLSVLLSACSEKTPDFYPLGISVEEIKAVYEPMGYKFSNAVDIYGQPQETGTSPSQRTLIQLVGPPENLVSVRITSKVSTGLSKTELNTIRGDMERMFTLVLPEWKDGKDWFKEKTLEVKNNGSRTTTQNGVGVKLRVVERNFTFGVSFGAWEGTADITDDGWITNE